MKTSTTLHHSFLYLSKFYSFRSKVRAQPYTNQRARARYNIRLQRVLPLGFAALFICFASTAISAQSSVKHPNKPSANNSSKESEGSSTAANKKQAVENVRGFAEQITSFKDGRSKALALTRLADVLWDYDQPYSRQLFAEAAELTKPQSGTHLSEAQALSRLRTELITVMAKRDPDMAKRLTEQAGSATEADEVGNAQTNFQIAYEAVKSQPDKSVELAKRSLESGIPPFMSFLLFKLKQRNPAAADELFLLTLQRLSAEPAVDADTLLQLGTYIFTSPRIDPKDPNSPPGTISYVGVGNVLVVDITADLPDIPPQLILEYLTTAAGALNRPLPSPEQHAKMYAAGYLLLRKAYKHAPELTSPISAAMQTLSQSVPREMTSDEAYKNLKLSPRKDLSDTLDDLDKEPDSEYRNAQYLALVYDLWQQADFAGAAKVNDKISDTETRDALSTIINFGKAARLVERGGSSLVEAENIRAKLPPGLGRAVLMLGIANSRARGRDSQRTVEALNAALADINKVNSAHRPYLLINIAGLSAQSDPALAPAILNEAIRQFNSQQGKEFDLTWNQRVELGGLWREFPLSVKGVNFDLSSSLQALVKLDPQSTVFSIRTLTDEELLARVLPALAEGMLH